MAMQAANDLRRILLDDGRSDQNPEPPPYFAVYLDSFAGRRHDFHKPLGALDYSFSTFYRIQPTEVISFTRVNQRPKISRLMSAVP